MSAPVVYIDDEPALCRVYELVFRSFGKEIVTFIDPVAAIEYLRAHDASVVFCDHRMPRLSGLEVLAQVGPRFPFYLVTGDLDAAATLSAPGVCGVLAKPCRAEQMIDIVDQHEVRQGA